MRDALLATVIEEVAAVQAFESLLAHEEKALIAAQPLAELPGIIEEKTALTERIGTLEKQRDAQLGALGLPGWVMVRFMGCVVPGAVVVDGGAEKVREPRDPELPPPPMRASA